MNNVYVIAIAGGSASGKSTIALSLYDYFNDDHNVTILRQDDYYKDQSHLSFEQRVKTNYDHPHAFDNDLFVEHIIKLKNKETISKPLYDYAKHNRKEETEKIEAKDILIIEGLFVLYDQRIRDLCDLLIYVDTESDVRLMRRISRDVKERGRDLESVCEQYMTTVKPMHQQFVEPTKQYAHVIIPNGYHQVSTDLLITKIKSLLNES